MCFVHGLWRVTCTLDEPGEPHDGVEQIGVDGTAKFSGPPTANYASIDRSHRTICRTEHRRGNTRIINTAWTAAIFLRAIKMTSRSRRPGFLQTQ
ncbi:conserved hypothetical protein [Burkholderia cenocepacia HI2424]|uniref:Uncharacterized protein n=2 Tax=Burkholderia cepacia complex TaxID=87882 RepID=A0AAQ0JII4_BURCE|nr:conserved hypothetical protein [Burkholderia cenocepacia HI2424]ASE92212.1 hypothetical protein CEQ23_00620 [Burkholderia cepacia]PNO74141.1 hypothetical protein DK10_024975 [Burkholderia cenocepacia]QCY09269.1 hypothetical protein EJ998_40495 [Burkholderia cepacia ATCC 25416]THJ48908.1 hypothetical protein E9536_34205 [Burkholderia sp. LS-044]